MWIVLVSCADPEPKATGCPSECPVDVSVTPPADVLGVLSIRTDPPDVGFSVELDGPDETRFLGAGAGELDLEFLPGDLVAGVSYTVRVEHACEPGEAKLGCETATFDFVVDGATTDPTPTPDGPVEDVFVGDPTVPVDVLFVIDDSGSMGDVQQAIVDQGPILFDWLSGLDFRVGVTTTAPGAAAGRLESSGGDRWVDGASRDPVSLFAALASVGTGGASVEAGLGAAWGALGAGFLRDGSVLVVLTVSDEDDQTPPSTITLDDFVAFFGDLQDTRRVARFDPVVLVSGPDRGDRYAEVADRTGGTVHDLATVGFDEVYEAAARAIYRTTYCLSEDPRPATIELLVETVEGVELVFSEGADWTYDADANCVSLLEYVPELDSVVIVRYAPAG